MQSGFQVVDGSRSSWRDVTSGPPGLSYRFFLLYINDIQDNIQSPMKLFADDCAIYREIATKTTTKPYSVISNSLSMVIMTGWWNSTESKSVRFYGNHKKAQVGSHEYLISEVISKGKPISILGSEHPTFVGTNTAKPLAVPWASEYRRTLPSCSKEVKARAYTALVRPQLEYGSFTTVNGLEQIQ